MTANKNKIMCANRAVVTLPQYYIALQNGVGTYSGLTQRQGVHFVRMANVNVLLIIYVC